LLKLNRVFHSHLINQGLGDPLQNYALLYLDFFSTFVFECFSTFLLQQNIPEMLALLIWTLCICNDPSVYPTCSL